MNELVVVDRGSEWRRFKAMVLSRGTLARPSPASVNPTTVRKWKEKRRRP